VRGQPSGPLAIEWSTRYFIIDHVRGMQGFSRDIVSGEALVNACRMIKSPAELALLQGSNDITIAAIRHVHDNVKVRHDRAGDQGLLEGKIGQLGGAEPFSLVLLNDASAYPHGSEHPQSVRDGSVILVDTGCKLNGYSSDISRTWVFGTPSKRQREVWDTVKRGQEIALETCEGRRPRLATSTSPCANTTRDSDGPRTTGSPAPRIARGHGIGMDGHEPPNLMRADRTPFQVGMCFSDEPGIYIPGEFGIRMEDCWTLTEQGPKLFTGLAKSIDEPI
jgi:Xaa-Pro dipeptidase